MTKRTGSTDLKHYVIPVIVSVLVVTLILGIDYLLPERNISVVRNEAPTELARLALSAAVDTIKLLINWTLATAGAFVYLFKLENNQSPNAVPHSLSWYAVGLLACVLSASFGYAALDRIVIALSQGSIDVTDPSIAYAVQWQRFSFLVAVVAFIVRALTALRKGHIS